MADTKSPAAKWFSPSVRLDLSSAWETERERETERDTERHRETQRQGEGEREDVGSTASV